MIVETLGYERAEILLWLYNHACFCGVIYNQGGYVPPVRIMTPGSLHVAQQLIDNAIKTLNFKFDMVDLGEGQRPIKVDLSDVRGFNSTVYDRYNGYDGYAFDVIKCQGYITVSKLKEQYDARQMLQASYRHFVKYGLFATGLMAGAAIVLDRMRTSTHTP